MAQAGYGSPQGVLLNTDRLWKKSIAREYVFPKPRVFFSGARSGEPTHSCFVVNSFILCSPRVSAGGLDLIRTSRILTGVLLFSFSFRTTILTEAQQYPTSTYQELHW